jgi:hypothetical protein
MRNDEKVKKYYQNVRLSIGRPRLVDSEIDLSRIWT